MAGTAQSPRRQRAAAASEQSASSTSGPSADLPSADGPADGRRARPHSRSSADRYWRELTGAGRTNLSGTAAARVRETPDLTDEELADAARTVVLQRRNWSPS